MPESNTEKELWQAFMPHAFKRIAEIRKNGTKFVHYTSAYAATQIIEKRTVWMRNALVMNDFSEIQHGQSCLKQSWDDEKVGGRLKALLNQIQPGLADMVTQGFDSRLYDRRFHSFLTSIRVRTHKSA